MKIAYCIECHENTNILRELIRIISKDNDVYVHIDKKSNISEFHEYLGKVNFIEDRVNVRWGEFSQIEATLKMLNCVNKNKYDYICLLSGDCLPLKSSFDIKNFFQKNTGKEFLGMDFKFDYAEIEKRILYRHYSISYKKSMKKYEEIFMKIVEKFNLYKKNKYFSLLPKLYKGSNWFCITGELNEYILNYIEKNSFYVKAFRNSLCGDEIFFQTIVGNSKYKDNIYKLGECEDDNAMALRYIDWKTGPEYPKILDENDFENMKDEDYIFARKFNKKLNIKKYREFFKV